MDPFPSVETDLMPTQHLDTFWAQNVLGQCLLFALYQLVYLQLLLLLAWGCFCPLPGLGQEPGSQTGALLPSPFTTISNPTGAALYVVITVPDSFVWILSICSLCYSQINRSKTEGALACKLGWNIIPIYKV